jgi:hypothetical protein
MAAAGRDRVIREFGVERVADEFERVASGVLAP